MKAVPAYERSLDPSETEEVPKAFQIPKLGKMFCKIFKKCYHKSLQAFYLGIYKLLQPRKA